MAMTNVIPKYLTHISFNYTENSKSITLDVGDDVAYVFITSNCPAEVTDQTIIAAMIAINDDGTFYIPSNRLLTRTVNGTYDYWQPTSSTHIWSYSNGVITISWEGDYFMGAGITYDAFIYKF